MIEIRCMACRRLLAKFDSVDVETDAPSIHVAGCPDCVGRPSMYAFHVDSLRSALRGAARRSRRGSTVHLV